MDDDNISTSSVNKIPVINDNKISRIQKNRETIAQKFYEIMEDSKMKPNSSSILLKINIKTISIILGGLYFISFLFTIFFIDKKYYTDKITKEKRYKKLFLVSLYFMLGNIVYLSIFYYILKKFTII